MGVFCANALAPTFFLLWERIVFNFNPRGYLEFAHTLARIGFLPPDTASREWSIWEETYKYARPGANFGYEAQGYVIFVIPAIFMSYHLGRVSASAWARRAFMAIAVVLLSGLLLSLARTGIFAFLVCCLLYARSTRKFWFAGFAALLVAVLIAAFPDNYFIARYTMRSTDAYPMAAKFVQMGRSFEAMVTSPANFLFGNPVLTDKSMGGFNPHDQFLDDLLSRGIGAFVFGFAMFPALLNRLRKRLRPGDGPDGDYSETARIIRACIISMFVQCFSTGALLNSNTAIMLWVPVFFLLQMTDETKVYRIAWG